MIFKRLRIENAHLQKSPRVEISMRFRGALRSFSQPRKTRAHLRAILLEAHLCISESETPFAPDIIGRFLPLTFVR